MYTNQLFNPQELMQQCMNGIVNSARSGSSAREEYIRDFACYCEDIESGRVECPPAFARIISRLVKAGMEEYGAKSPASRMSESAEKEGSEEHQRKHRKFKEVLEKLREVPLNERSRVLEEHFTPQLTPEERVVLMELADDRSLRHKAGKVRMTPEEFVNARHSAESKVKES